jgi:radical SAM protein with 4Fe4S-binding SPASM domain
MTASRWARHLEECARLRAEHPLRYLFLEVTRRCNLRCAYCGSSCAPGDRRGEMDAAKWISVIDQIADSFDAARIMVAVTGGEPLVREDILEILGALAVRGFRFGMVSNGALIDDVTAARLVASGIGSISLSMDGPKALNDALRGEGAADGVANAVRALRAAGYDGILEIISTVTKPVVPQLDEMRKIVARLRVRRWRVAPVMPLGRALGRPELLLDAGDVRALLGFIRDGRADGLLPPPEMSEEGYLGEEYEGAVRPYLCRCGAGVTIGGVLYDGRIGACPELSDAFVQGHIDADRFADVWEERYGVFRDRAWARRGPCASCDAFDICRGGAMHLYEGPGSEFSRCFFMMLAGDGVV